jgi:hypothetical protein
MFIIMVIEIAFVQWAGESRGGRACDTKCSSCLHWRRPPERITLRIMPPKSSIIKNGLLMVGMMVLCWYHMDVNASRVCGSDDLTCPGR